MSNRISLSISKLTKTACVMLALTCTAGTLGGCEKPDDTHVSQNIVPYTMPSATESSETEFETHKEMDPDKPIMIWKYEDLNVPFGKLSDNVGFFQLGLTDKDSPNYIMSGHFIYCLAGYDGDYKCYRINLEEVQKSGVARIMVNDGTVKLLDFGIKIITHGEMIYYDFNFNEIYRSNMITDENILVPYKDGYILKEGANLKILHLDEEKPYRTLDSADYILESYHYTSDNTYLVLKDGKRPDRTLSNIYDINRKYYWRGFPANTVISDSGLIWRAQGKYCIANFALKKVGKYKNQNPGSIGSSLSDGTKHYFFDEADRKIKYYVPSKQLVCVLSEAEFTQGATLTGLYGGYVYAEYANVMYYIDPKGQKELSAENYIRKATSEAAALKKNLEFHHGIKILYGKDTTKLVSKHAKIDPVTSDLVALNAMKKISVALKKFNYSFFHSFVESRQEGVSIVLSGSMTVSGEISGLEGHSFTGENAYYIIIDYRSPDVASAFCREVMHTIENKMTNPKQVFEKWDSYNPPDFAYLNTRSGAAEAYYIPDTEDDRENVYFTDAYACASAKEDRARLFAALFMPEEYGKNLRDYPRIMAKAAELKHVIITYHPALADTPALSSIG